MGHIGPYADFTFTFTWRIKFLEGYEFPANPLVVVISPLILIAEDQVKYLRSLGVKAGYVGESKTSDREILDGKGDYTLLYGSLESMTGDNSGRCFPWSSTKKYCTYTCHTLHVYRPPKVPLQPLLQTY